MAGSSRRGILTGGAALAGASVIGLPGLLKAQSDKIRIGHLTPLTGFLGVLGEYAVLGIRMAEEEINAAGGVLGRPLEVMSGRLRQPGDGSDQSAAHDRTRRRRLLMGEINSASALTITQVAARNKKLFMSIDARSDSLRGENCNRYFFSLDTPSTVMVNTVGLALLRDNVVKDKKFFSVTADYLFGHDLLGVAKAFFAAHEGTLLDDEPT